jgi:hypothetical protein
MVDPVKIFLIALTSFIIISIFQISNVFADSCSESGYAWCNQYTYGDATAKIALSVYDVNNVQWSSSNPSIPYVLVKNGFQIKYTCGNGDAYYDIHNCDYTGCQGQHIASSGVMTIGSGLSSSIYMKRMGCFVKTQHADGSGSWAAAWFIEFYPSYGSQNVEILTCGQNNDCADSETCFLTGNPISWTCQNVVCPAPNCQPWESSSQNIANHACTITCNLMSGKCYTNNDCSNSETCNSEHACIPLDCNDNDPCTTDEYIGHACVHNRIYTGSCDPCVAAATAGKIDDGNSCTVDSCSVANDQAVITHTPVQGFCIEDKVKIIIISAVAGVVIVGIIALIWLKTRKKKHSKP